jgi:hypothetical protein
VLQYPELSLELDEYLVIEPDGAWTVYRNWQRHYTPETITAALAAQGFQVEGIWGDLTGEPYREAGQGIGVVARRSP